MASQFDNPKALKKNKVCLNQVSKNFKEGKLTRLTSVDEVCEVPNCKTRKLTHSLVLITSTHACDSTISKELDGRIEVKELVTAKLLPPRIRGMHSGSFVWTGTATSGLVVEGTMNGFTNLSPHRKPFIGSAACEQKCETRLLMEGRISGKVTAAKDKFKNLIGCEVLADYRLRLNSPEEDPSSVVAGTLEGLIVCLCKQ